jgi:hypothetical protein
MAPKLTECIASDQGDAPQKRSKTKLAITVAVAVGVGAVALASSARNAYADAGECPDGQCGSTIQDGGGSGCGSGSGCGWALVLGTPLGG